MAQCRRGDAEPGRRRQAAQPHHHGDQRAMVGRVAEQESELASD
jgi:hypothetical protein